MIEEYHKAMCYSISHHCITLRIECQLRSYSRCDRDLQGAVAELYGAIFCGCIARMAAECFREGGPQKLACTMDRRGHR